MRANVLFWNLVHKETRQLTILNSIVYFLSIESIESLKKGANDVKYEQTTGAAWQHTCWPPIPP